MVNRCSCHQAWDGHWHSSVCSSRWSLAYKRKDPVLPQSWPWLQVWCVAYSRKNRFHSLSRLDCGDQAWGCLAGMPQQPRLYHLHHIIPQPSSDLLFPVPVSSQKDNSFPLFFLHWSYFCYINTQICFVFIVSSVISALYDVSDVYCCPCKISQKASNTPL